MSDECADPASGATPVDPDDAALTSGAGDNGFGPDGDSDRDPARNWQGTRDHDRNPSAVGRQLLRAVRQQEPTAPLRSWLANAGHDDLETIRTDEAVGRAFWLNVYNATAQELLAERPHLYDSLGRVRFFRTTAITVAGVDLSLDDIEHGILRSRRSKYGLGYLPRLERTGLPQGYELPVDPRIHFALNCGAESCPLIFAYDATDLEASLGHTTRTYLEGVVSYDAEGNTVRVPQLCLWFLGDFGGRAGVWTLLEDHELVPPGSNPSLRPAGYDWTKAPRAFATRSRLEK